MNNENFPGSTSSPNARSGEQGPDMTPTDPVTLPNDQFLPEHVETDSASRVGAAHGVKDESKLAQAGEATKDLAAEGQHSAAEVMDTAKQEATMVAGQAKEQAAHLFEELSADLREQTSLQQRKVAENLRDISNEFRSMLDQSQASGTAATLEDQASHHSGRVADWLGQREPGSGGRSQGICPQTSRRVPGHRPGRWPAGGSNHAQRQRLEAPGSAAIAGSNSQHSGQSQRSLRSAAR